MYRWVHMIFVVKCVTVTCFFPLLVRCDGKAWFLLFCHPLKLYMILYSTGTVFFHCSNISWGLGQNVKIPYFHTYGRERKYTANVQCSVQYTLLLLYLMLVMSYLRNLSIKLYRIYVCYMNITLYHVVYSIRYYPRFSITMVGLRTYYPRIRWSACSRILEHM